MKGGLKRRTGEESSVGKKAQPRSAFDEYGTEAVLDEVNAEITDLYLSDSTPWVVGYSGGKDSTAVLQLVWTALERLGPEKARKQVHVISTDTLVENPIVASWVESSLDKINQIAEEKRLPIRAHRLVPALADSFWVNLIGKGYPAPRQKFRWCTERLKIKPSHAFISSMVDKHGETILVLGTRKAESAARARTMARHQAGRPQTHLSPNATLSNSMIYTPIEDWTNDDVWMFILENSNPWGHDNMELFTLYKGASEDGECPLVVSTNTPSCGDSRFGCWVCTLVEKDKSMQAMVRNSEDKEWMLPLLEIRNEIDFRNMSEDGDKHLRDFRRMNGSVQLFHGGPIHGPYKQQTRESLLCKLLSTQLKVRAKGPDHVRNIELIRIDELEEIRRIWVVEKHELEDSLPRIYKEAIGEPYPGRRLEDGAPFRTQEMDVLKSLCEGEQLHYEMVRELLSIESRQRNVLRRSNLFTSLEETIKRHYYESQDDAVAYAQRKLDLHSGEGEPAVPEERKTLWLEMSNDN